MHKMVAVVLLSLFCYSVTARSVDITVNESNSVYLSARIFPPLSNIVVGSGNERCRDDSRTLLDNLRNFTTWAVQIFDASACSTEGFLIGSSFHLGNWYECINNEGPITVQYCLVTLTIEPPTSVTPSQDKQVFYNPLGTVWNKIWHIGDPDRIPRDVVHQGLCVPASCPHTDIQASISSHLEESSTNRTFKVDLNPSFCQTNRDAERLSIGSIIFCCVMGSLLLLVVVSTWRHTNKYPLQEMVGDQITQEQERDCNHDAFFTMFSLRRNWLSLVKQPKNVDFRCINGIKVFGTFFVILGHRFFLNSFGPFLNYERFEREKFYFQYGFLLQLEITVDIFFVISGLLVTHVLLTILEERSVNPFVAIASRYIRLTPVYALLVFFFATMMYHSGEGPLWTALVGRERQFCQENWWTNLLFIHNYINDDRMCMLHSWYLSSEFQFYTLSVFLVLLIHKRPRLGYTVLGVCLAASIISPFTITYLQHLDPVQFLNDDMYKLERAQPFFRQMYTKSHTHATPYLVGIIAGLVVYRNQKLFNRFKWQSTVGLVCGCLVAFGSLIPGCLMTSRMWDYSDVMAATEQPQRRFFWPLGVAIVIISLTSSKNSMVDKFLSSHVMIVLSRLCYSSYLVSLCIQLMLLAGSRVSPVLIGWSSTLTDAALDTLLTLIASLILYLTVEAPISRLMLKLLSRKFR